MPSSKLEPVRRVVAALAWGTLLAGCSASRGGSGGAPEPGAPSLARAAPAASQPAPSAVELAVVDGGTVPAPGGGAGDGGTAEEGGSLDATAPPPLRDGGESREATTPPPLPAGTKVLHVGDSFAAALGIELNKALEAHGVKGLLRYKTASFIPEWASGDDLPHYMRTHDPDLVIVTLGANETAMKEPAQRAAAVRKLVGVLGGRPCVWIATPLWGADNGLMDVIRANVAPCRFLDSNTASFFDDGTPVRGMPRLPDKIHPTMRARARWAGFVLEWLARERAPEPGRPWALRAE